MQNNQKPFVNRSWPYLLLAVLAVLFLGDVWFGGRSIIMRDYFFGEVPMRVFFGNAMRSGSFPTWIASNQCGSPVAASPYGCAFYPPNWVFILPSAEWAIRLEWTFHFALAAISSFLLARYWRLGIGPALFAGVSFAFCTFLMAWLEFSIGLWCMAWGPLLLLLTSRIIDRTAEEILGNPATQPWRRLLSIFRRNAASVAGMAAVLALQVLANGEIFYHFGLIVAIYGVARWFWHGSWKAAAVSMGLIGLAGALGIALASPFFLLTLEMMKYSTRAGEVDALMHVTSAHPSHWLTLLLPYLYGRPGYPNAYWAKTIYEFALGTGYVGILPLIGLFFCWLRPKGQEANPAVRERRFLVWFFVALTLAGLMMAAGEYTPVYGFLHHWLPGLGHFRFPTKFYLFVVFALAMLGALGLQALLESGETKGAQTRVRLWWCAAACGGVLVLGYLLCLLNGDFLLWLMAHPATPTAEQIAATLADYTWAVVFTLLGLGFFGMLAFRRGPQKWAQAGIVAVAFINLCIISRQAQPTIPAGIYSKKPDALAKKIGGDPLVRHLSIYENTQQWRYGDNRPEMWEWAIDSGATNHVVILGLMSIKPGGLPPTRYMEIYNAILSAPPPLCEKLADMLSVRYVIGGGRFDEVLWGNAPRDVRVVTRPNSLPRARLVGNWRFATGDPALLQAIVSAGFDPRREAILEPLDDGTTHEAPVATAEGSPGEVRAFEDHQERVTMEVTAKRPALLVLGDIWYPGWTVKVDGVTRPIFQTNYLFRGVFIEPGTHRVEFSYWPTHLTLGLWMSGLAVLACVALTVLARFAPPLAPKS